MFEHLPHITDLIVANSPIMPHCIERCGSGLRRLDITGCEFVSTRQAELGTWDI